MRITVEILSLPGKIHETVATFPYMILKFGISPFLGIFGGKGRPFQI